MIVIPDDVWKRIEAWDQDADEHWSAWRKQARQSYAFVANDQWSRDEKTGVAASAWYVGSYLGLVDDGLRHDGGFGMAARRVGQ